jgi:hypothetical protein
VSEPESPSLIRSSRSTRLPMSTRRFARARSSTTRSASSLTQSFPGLGTRHDPGRSVGR